MKSYMWGAGLALLSLSGPAQAASLCNCCGKFTAQSCATACAEVTPPADQCQATVDYTADAEIGPGANPLYGISLRNINLGHSKPPELEALRRLLERSRRAAERDRRTGWRQFEKGKIDKAAVDASDKRYDGALVNYFLAVSAFHEAQLGK